MLAGIMMLSMTGCGNNRAKSYSQYVTLGNYKGIEYTKTVAEVTEDDIQQQVDSFLANLAEEKEVTGRAVKNGDIVNIDYVGTMDGEVFDGGSAEGADLTIGSHRFIDGFEEGLIGHEIDEEVSLDLQFPDPYDNNPDFAGKDVNFKVTINGIKELETPKLTDALVKEQTEYDTVKAYRDSIRENLEASNEANAEQLADSSIFQQVAANCQVTGYDEAEVKRLVDVEFDGFKQTAESYEAYGYSYEDVLTMYGYETEDKLKDGITEYVKNYLDQKMIIYCIAAQEGIKVTSEETDALVGQYMASNNIESKDEVYEYFEETYGSDYFEYQVLAEKVMDFLRENAVLVDSTEGSDSDGGEDTEATTEADTEAEEETEESTTEEDTTESTTEEKAEE